MLPRNFMLNYSLIYINSCTYYQTPSHSPEMFGVRIQLGASEYRDPVPDTALKTFEKQYYEIIKGCEDSHCLSIKAA